MTNPKQFGILFDYNGVLADDEHLHEKATAQAVAPYGVELTNAAYREHCLGYNDRKGFSNVKRAFAATLADVSVPTLMRSRLAHYQKLAEIESVLHSAAATLIPQLAKSFQIGLITSSWREEVMPPLATANIAQHFEVMITLDDITHGKPHPEGYLKGLKALGLPAQHVVVIEDTVSGVTAAKAAGLKTIALLSTTSRDELTQADELLPSLADLTPTFIQRVLSG